FQHLKVDLQAIKSATNGFDDSHCIGKGGFGKVYKGELVHSKGQSVVAIKRLDRAFGQGDPEFWKEIIMLSLYRHNNIVSLRGFCDDCGEKILVYDYASKRSLDLYLNDKHLTWVQRLEICIGAARGLAYLHNPEAAYDCLNEEQSRRPNIDEIVLRLEKALELQLKPENYDNSIGEGTSSSFIHKKVTEFS
nr:protein kinase, ATP binding site-containing protein [Tanacetum cinerariifolium]